MKEGEGSNKIQNNMLQYIFEFVSIQYNDIEVFDEGV